MRTEDVDDFLSCSNRYDNGSGFFTASEREIFDTSIQIALPIVWECLESSELHIYLKLLHLTILQRATTSNIQTEETKIPPQIHINTIL